MPWIQTDVFMERVKFVLEYEKGFWSMAALCEAFGISRKTGHKYWNRYREGGLDGLKDRS